jgi:ABC-type transport system substrate-binding protein
MRVLIALLVTLSGGLPASAADKVLHYAFEAAETTFDPPRISDLYSNIVNQAMFDAPLTYDYLARPAKLKPNTVTSLPEVSADGRSYTFHVRPGIYFSDDPAFMG